MINILGWIGNGFFVLGAYALGKKSTFGFYANIVANIAYIWQSILLDNIPLVWLSFILILLNCKGVIEWSNKCYVIIQGK